MREESFSRMDSVCSSSFTEDTEYGSIFGVAVSFISPPGKAKSTARSQPQGR